MARIIHTESLTVAGLAQLSVDHRLQIYNGFDSCLTNEIQQVIKPLLLGMGTGKIYKFERALQGPALDMMLRGIPIDPFVRQRQLTKLLAEEEQMKRYLNDLGVAFGVYYLNANSPKVLSHLFYTVLDLPEQTVWDPKKGKMRVTTNRQALETLSDYFIAQPFINAIFACRDIGQHLAVLKTAIRDGRMYTSLNQGKETGRWSSTASVFGDGRNLQNIMESLREMFVPDIGYRMGYSDLSQAESFCVAYLSGDENYIQAHLSGDVHTFVSKLVWPEVEDVNSAYYRHWTYRDLSKRGGHATNYYATPWTIAKHLKIPIHIAQEFQNRYFAKFPGIKLWHAHVAKLLGTTGTITTALDRKRVFFNRLNDDTTLREAIAYDPQSLVADILSYGMLQVWQDCPQTGIQLLLPVHDAILYQYPVGRDSVIPSVEAHMRVPVSITDIHGTTRIMCIPVETKAGYNWRPIQQDRKTKVATNLEGMVKYGSEEFKTQQPPQSLGLLDRVVS